jgi:hypothetical protein
MQKNKIRGEGPQQYFSMFTILCMLFTLLKKETMLSHVLLSHLFSLFLKCEIMVSIFRRVKSMQKNGEHSIFAREYE